MGLLVDVNRNATIFKSLSAVALRFFLLSFSPFSFSSAAYFFVILLCFLSAPILTAVATMAEAVLLKGLSFS